ncbi:MAG: hypothetical protein ACOH10_08570 [Rhodoglobus sp.]
MVWKDTVIEVAETVEGSLQDAAWRDVLGSNPTSIVRIRTASAELEWAMVKRFDGLALEALGVPEESVSTS